MTTPSPSQMSNEELLRELASLLPKLSDVDSSSTERWSKYIPHKPTPKQQEFLDLECDEKFFGGAAGGGKSDALLMWILQGVDTPGYAGLILRRTFAQLEKPGCLIPRSHEWLANTDAHWNGSKNRWTFPSGAVIQFGHLQHEINKYDYQGGEYHRMAFDEATHFTETQYTYLLSRLRRTVGFPIQPGAGLASNPGGEGHYWVKNRFVSEESIAALLDGRGGTFWNDGRAFIPSRIADNPHIDEEEYMRQLSHLPPVTRARLAKGDWSVIEDAILKVDWFRYYGMQGQILRPFRADNTLIDPIDERDCQRFLIVDCAGTSQDKAREKRGKPPSYSVVGTWDWFPLRRWLFLRHIWRDRVEFVDLCDRVIELSEQWGSQDIRVENEKYGQAVASTLAKRNLQCKMLSAHAGLSKHSGVAGKVERSYAFQNMLSEGRIFFPQYNNEWLLPFEQELLAWTGHEDDIADQVDNCSYAAMECSETGQGVVSQEAASVIWGGIGIRR